MIRSPVVLTLAAALATLATGCAGPDHWYLSGERPEVHWGYEGAEGPDHWGGLSREFALADEGRSQSPVDLVTAGAEAAELPALTFRYHATDAHVVNNGHTLQHDEHEDNHLLWGDERWNLKQYHLHTPSEHTVDGFHAACELHLVHEGADGRVLVVGVLAVAGEDHLELLDNLPSLPAEGGEEADLPVAHDPSGWLPDERTYWNYDGSFTTPPCTEGVTWIVLREPIAVPQAFLRAVGGILGRNNRPTQPLNDRVVRVGG